MFASQVGDANNPTLDRLAADRRDLDAREAAWLRNVADYDRSGAWRDGYQNAAAALAARCHMTEGAAPTHVELARSLEDLPAVADAFATGAVSRHHASVIAKACTPDRVDAMAELVPTLVAAATRMHPRELGSFVQHSVDRLDGDGGAADDEALRAWRRVIASRRIDRMVASDALLDPEVGEVYLTALSAEMTRDRRLNETRTPGQRRTDALVNICRRSLDENTVGGTRNARPHITMVVDLEHCGTNRSWPPLVPRPSTPDTSRRARWRDSTCDCSVNRVITAGRSEILDVGRATRTIPPVIWWALVVRDRQCAAPGCDRPPGRCEAHHIRHWENGGPTSLENLKLLCWHHQHEAHKNDPPRRGP